MNKTSAHKLAYMKAYRANNPAYAEAHRQSSRARYYANRETILAERKVRRVLNPRKYRAYRIQRTYGLTLEQWEAKLLAQGNRCACCGGSDPMGKNWATDHNHQTGQVREILCNPCNAAVGMLAEQPTRAYQVADYLKKHTETT